MSRSSVPARRAVVLLSARALSALPAQLRLATHDRVTYLTAERAGFYGVFPLRRIFNRGPAPRLLKKVLS